MSRLEDIAGARRAAIAILAQDHLPDFEVDDFGSVENAMRGCAVLAGWLIGMLGDALALTYDEAAHLVVDSLDAALRPPSAEFPPVGADDLRAAL